MGNAAAPPKKDRAKINLGSINIKNKNLFITAKNY